MLASIFSLNVIQTALELGCIYGLVALALFLSYSILNIADLSTDGCFTLGCAVACQVALTGHPILALFAAMAAGVCSGFVTAFLQTRLGVESIMACIPSIWRSWAFRPRCPLSRPIRYSRWQNPHWPLRAAGISWSSRRRSLYSPVPPWSVSWAPGWAFPSAPPATTPPWCGPPASTRPSPSQWACASRAR